MALSACSCLGAVLHVLPELGRRLGHLHLSHLCCTLLLDANSWGYCCRLMAGKIQVSQTYFSSFIHLILILKKNYFALCIWFLAFTQWYFIENKQTLQSIDDGYFKSEQIALHIILWLFSTTTQMHHKSLRQLFQTATGSFLLHVLF